MAIKSNNRTVISWKRRELPFLVLYAIAFYVVIISRSLQLSHGNNVHHLLQSPAIGVFLSNHFSLLPEYF